MRREGWLWTMGLALVLAATSVESFSSPRTTYKVGHRQAYRKVSHPEYVCGPEWKRRNAFSPLGCPTAAICRPPCLPSRKCSLPNDCACPGWTGRCCQTDVDECATGKHGCSQLCINTAGSYRCTCHPGYELQADGQTCRALKVPPTPAPPGSDSLPVPDEVRELRSRLAALEEKFQLILAPFLKLDLPGAREGPGTAEPISLVVHLIQQLDRIDSLSEQISFLEERLETCRWRQCASFPPAHSFWAWPRSVTGFPVVQSAGGIGTRGEGGTFVAPQELPTPFPHI
ncbi:epidermal growth factor-like protein 7 isoform X2 [Thamnophis elegans]|uniref:epidermal growth factor-like protein 7 isoform X2 n=1 Tax=Thamnophis elegans TaxID=35005 RepID=UPI001377CBC4|nr:epidermal growth factor-like protein 7 isoform X2 [Thamnophis elegans]